VKTLCPVLGLTRAEFTVRPQSVITLAILHLWVG
jgi:hypothetical protein